MTNLTLENQVSELTRKLDLVLDEMNNQRLRREKWDDLADDVTIIGKDIFDVTVRKLDNAGVELDAEALEEVLMKLLRNVSTINKMLDTLESAADLMKDASPIIHQVGLDAIYKMHEMEQKGYFAFIAELGKVMDNIVTHFTVNDIRGLADNIVTILETVKRFTQPDMLDAANNAIAIYKSVDINSLEEYSLWRAFRELNSPEGRKAVGFMMTFLKNIASTGQQKDTLTTK